MHNGGQSGSSSFGGTSGNLQANNLEGAESNQVISQSSWLFLSLAFGPMILNGKNNSGIHDAVELIQEMASSKQIISIRKWGNVQGQ